MFSTNCSGDTAADTPTPLLSEPWRLADKTADLYAASCPEGSVFITPEDIDLTVDAVELYDADETPPEVFAGLHYIGGFELESDDPRFGGLSGLAITRSGNLIAVSDAGHFVWIGLDEEDGFTPVSAALSDMKRQDGSPAETKSEVDAEGLAFADGLALVSFEQSHRISAFDLETCGAAARAAPITAFSSGASFGVGKSVKTNGGIEGLALGPSGGLAAGLETLIDGRAPMSFEARDRVVDFDKRFADMDGRALTGLDYLVDPQDDDAGVLFAVHRSFNLLTGPNVAVTATPVFDRKPDMSAARTLLILKRPQTVDNFEAIAARRFEDGSVRLFILSDDNYQPVQRTLLLAFDVTPELSR